MAINGKKLRAKAQELRTKRALERQFQKEKRKQAKAEAQKFRREAELSEAKREAKRRTRERAKRKGTRVRRIKKRIIKPIKSQLAFQKQLGKAELSAIRSAKIAQRKTQIKRDISQPRIQKIQRTEDEFDPFLGRKKRNGETTRFF